MTRSFRLRGERRTPRLASALAVGVALLLQAPAARADKLPIDPGFAADASWDDGLAEVSVYEAARSVYGAPRPYDLTVIVVKEDLDDRLHVKADPPYEGRALTTVLKMNLAATIATENYPYHYLTSIFARRDDLRRLVKASVGSQEWCGNTFKELRTWGGPPEIHFHSYFDAQGDGTQPLDLAEDGLLDEQLLLAIRAVVLSEGASVSLRVADPITSSAARPISMGAATLTAGAIEEVGSPAGRIPARRYVLRRAIGGEISYWVEIGGARALVRMESSDGSRMLLRGRSRRDYWSRRADQ